MVEGWFVLWLSLRGPLGRHQHGIIVHLLSADRVSHQAAKFCCRTRDNRPGFSHALWPLRPALRQSSQTLSMYRSAKTVSSGVSFQGTQTRRTVHLREFPAGGSYPVSDQSELWRQRATHYCQQVVVHFGGTQLEGCVELNLQRVSSHTICETKINGLESESDDELDEYRSPDSPNGHTA